jgi:hypothetical protein
VSQVSGFWSWCDWLREQAVAIGREPLFLNLDETAVPQSSPDAIGMVVRKRWWPAKKRPVQRVPKSKRRGMVTHVGLVTHNSTVQGRLPQIVVGNKRCFTPEMMNAAVRSAPAKVKFWRKKSSWVNTEIMLDILREIALTVAEFPELQPILVMDCAPVHLARQVLDRAAVLGIWILPVPARCTFLLQPCDTHVVSPYKAFLRRLYRECKTDEGVVTPEAWLHNLVDAATKFMCGRTWRHAFEQTGLLGDRSHLTRDLAAVEPELHLAQQPVRAPMLRTVRQMLPEARRVPYSQLLSEPLGRSVRIRLY